MRRALDDAYQMTHGRLPVDVQTSVGRIRQRILALVPRAEEFPVGSMDLFLLQRAAVEYLPTTLTTYLALPPTYAATRRVADEGTPLDLLRRQLWLLETRLDQIAEAVSRRDSDRLVAHGRFLEEQLAAHGRFLEERLGHPSELDLDLPEDLGR